MTDVFDPFKSDEGIADPFSPGYAPPKKSGVGRRLADQGLALARGVIGVPEMLTGLADIPTGGRAGKALEGAGVRFKEAKDYLSTLQSPEQQAANLAVAEAKGFLPTIGAALENPSFIAQQVIENVPTMFGGGAIGRGLVAGVTKGAPALAARMGATLPVAAGAAGEGIITAGQNVEQVRQEEPGGLLTPTQVGLNALGGALTGGIAYGGGRLAQKFGLADVETLFAGGKVTTAAGKAPPGIVKRVGGGILSEGALQEAPQSYQEQVFQNLSQGKPATEGAAEAAAQGALVGGVMGGGANIIPPRPQIVPGAAPAVVPPTQVPVAVQPSPDAAPVAPTALPREAIVPPVPVEPAGPLTKALGGTVAPAATAPPGTGPLTKTATMTPAPVDESHPEMPAPVAPPLDLSMQNRDRSRPGSIEQMNAIAAAPDYDRLGVGRSPNEAAPMVSVAANAPEAIPPEDFGHTSRVVMADNSKIGVRYAVVEAPSVLASHNVDGSVNGDYFANVPRGTIRALNNGRVAALQAAWERGTAEPYKLAMIEDAKAHGIAPEAIMAKKNPMLVRVYDDIENSRPNIGALSNPQVALKPSAPETAHNDARILDAAALVPDDSGSVMGPQNEGALRQFLQAIPAAERNDLVGKSGYTKQFADRVRAALFAKAYGNTELVNLATEAEDPDIKNVLHALTAAAPEFAKVDPGGPLDVRPALLAAASMIREAKSKGMKPAEMLAQGDLMQREPMTRAWAGLMATNIRSPKRIAAAIQEAARFIGAQKQAATSGDMFGGQAATSADLFARVNKHLEDTYGPETQLRAAEQAAGYQEPAPGAGSRSNVAPGNLGWQPAQQQRAAVAPAAPEGVVREPVHDYNNYLRGRYEIPPGETRQELPPKQRIIMRREVVKAEENKPTFDGSMDKIAAATPGAEARKTGIKGPHRAISKIVAEYLDDNGIPDPTRIKDLVRGTIAVQSLNDVPAAIAGIEREFGQVPVDRGGKLRNSLAEGSKAGPDGYRDVLYNVLLKGRVYEVQVNHPDMLAMKDRMHKHLEVRDKIIRDAYVAGRDPTPAENAEIDRLNAEMSAAYTPIYERLLTSSRNSASESGGQPRSAASAGNLRPAKPGAQAVEAARSGPIDTATPSTLKKVVPLGKDGGSGVLVIGGASDVSVAKVAASSKVDANNLVIRSLARHKDNMAAFTDTSMVVPIDGLVSVKDETKSKKPVDPRVTAAGFMVKAINGTEKAREPLAVEPRPDGKYDVLDGNATVQAAKLAGWTKIPIQLRTAAEQARIEAWKQAKKRPFGEVVKENKERRAAERAAALQQLVPIFERDGIIVARRGEKSIAFMANAHGTSKFRIQYFDGDKPLGHLEYPSLAAAVNDDHFDSRYTLDTNTPWKVAQDVFELAGQTPTQAQVADMLKRKQAAEKARKQAAPAPESFALAGSNRAADLAIAQGQQDLFGVEQPVKSWNPAQRDLFELVDAAVQKAAGELELRSDENAKSRTARESALRELTQAGRLSVLAAAINVDLVKDGTASLMGRQITSLHDLATIAQVYRDPRYETLRYIFVKAGKVVHETAVSSRLPAATAAFAGDWHGFMSRLKETYARVGADGLWLSHNHPSGNPQPSEADKDLTSHLDRILAEKGAKLLGHVVVDTNGYGIIDRTDRDGSGWAMDVVDAPDLGKEKPFQFSGPLGAFVSGPTEIAEAAAQVKRPEHVALIGLTAEGRVSALAEIPYSELKSGLRLAGKLNRFARASGSGGGIFLAKVPATQALLAKDLVRRGILRDAVLESGTSTRMVLYASGNEVVRPYINMGHADRRGARLVAEPAAPYNPVDLFGNAVQVKVTTRKRIRTVAPEIADLFGPVESQAGLTDNTGKTPTTTKGEKPKPKAVFPGFGDLFGADNGPNQNGTPGLGGPQPGPVPPTGAGGNVAGVLPGKGGANLGSGRNDGGQQPTGPQGVGPGEQNVPGGEGGGGEQPTGDRPGNRPGRLPGVPAGRDIPAKTGRNYAFGPDDLTYVGGWLTKGRQNVAAIKLLRQLQAEGRQATREEQAVLAKYVGWGAGELANKLFGSNRWGLDESWSNLRNEVEDLLSADELAEASKSTQYAHYTSKEIVKGMWAAMRRMGFHGGALLEPGSGIGVFPGLMGPELANNTAYTGIEFEPIAGGILKQLFPDERILVDDFIKAALPKDFYDAAIGNPPFAAFKVLADPEYKKYAFALHDYFFAKTIDRVKPGGLVVFVSSHYTMDKRNDQARIYLAERADLVGAIRLPQTAFKKNAGTEVVTDVLFLRKKVPGETFVQGQDWMGVVPAKGPDGQVLMGTDANGKRTPLFINQYFEAHPEMVLGEHSTAGTMRAKGEYTVLPREGDIEQHFLDAVSKLPENVYRAEHGTSADDAKVQNLDFDPKAKKEGGFYLSDSGVLMRMSGGVGRLAEKQEPVLKSYVPLRDALKQAQYDQLNNGPLEDSLKALQKAYRRFVKDNGRIRENTPFERTTTKTDDVTGEEFEQTDKYRRWKHEKTLLQDPDYWLVAALENINEDTDEITESAALRERVLEKPKEPEIRTAADALAAVLNDTGKVDIARIADLAGITPEEAIAGLEGAIYLAPSGDYQTADEYLSGNVRKKLDEAIAAAASDKKYARNVEALRNVQPREILAKDINVRLGMNFIAPAVYDQFAREKLETRVETNYTKVTGRWAVDHRGGWNSPFDAGGMAAYKILEHAMTGAPIRITNTIRDDKGNEKVVLNQDSTAAANQRLVEMQDAFREWLFSDPERSAKIVADYNDQFNTIVPRQFNGEHMSLPGTSKLFNIFPHVKRGAWRIIQSGNTYLAHAVGSGKTFQMVISAMEQKRLGLINKPMMVVPRHMLAQFAAEWQALYPTARLMVADEKSFHTDKRREFVSRAALSDVDGIIITHSAFKLLDLDPVFKVKMIEQELEAFRAALVEAGGTLEPKRNPRTGKTIKSRDPEIKQIEAAIEALEQQLEAAASSAGKDQKSARFDEMGVDMLYVDEAHEYRRLGFSTQRSMKGIQPSGSQQAFDMWMKTRWLDDKHPGRSLVMASGTPVTNTVAELYTVMRYMDQAALDSRGIGRFDEWATMFGREKTDLEPNAAGEYEQVTRFARFTNLPELGQIFRNFADVLNSDQLGKLLGDKRPTVEGGARKIVVAPMTPALREYRKLLKERMAESREWKPSYEEPNNPDPVIRIIGDGRLAAIDMRFVNPAAPSDPKSKLNVMADNIIRVYQEANQPGAQVERGTQLVFSDIGLGEGVAERRGFNARTWLEKRLRDGGIPAREIAFIGDYSTAQKRLVLFRQMNEGKVRILVGGSRNLGTGTNVQQRLLAAHHLDTPWFPAHVEQREGRIIRAGNRNKVVQVYGYATKGSYDETMWKLVATKQRFIDQAMSGDPNLREIEDVSEVSNYEMASALLADDERVLKLAGLRSEVERLHRLYNSHEDDRGRATRDLAMAQAQIERIETRDLPAAEKNAKGAQDLSGDKFKATLEDTVYDKRKDWGAAVLAKSKELAAKVTEGSQQIGEISGFPVMFSGTLVYNDTRTKVLEYQTWTWMRRGDEKVVLSKDANDDPLGLAMRAGNIVADTARMPATLRAYLTEQKARVYALTPKIDAKFPFLAELLEKQQEQTDLEADIEKNPYVDPGDIEDEDVTPRGPRARPDYAGVAMTEGLERPAWKNEGGRSSPIMAEQPIFEYGGTQTPEIAAAEARQNTFIYGQTAPPAASWVARMDPATQEALRKAGMWQPKKSLKQRYDELMQDAGLKVLQGTVDRFRPVLARLGDYPYKLLRMASSYDAGLEAGLLRGRLSVNTAGALDIQRGTQGLVDILKPLRGEADRFLSWIAGNRAAQLAAEERERLFGDTDIARLRLLNRKMDPADNFPDGTSGDERAQVYADVLKEFNAWSSAILDIAEKSGTIKGRTSVVWDRDGNFVDEFKTLADAQGFLTANPRLAGATIRDGGRALWENEFYVPFYRDREGEAVGPGNVSGYLNPYAFKRLKGGTGNLHDLMGNAVANWSHLLQASMNNRAATETLDRAAAMGFAHQVDIPQKGSAFILRDGMKEHWVIDDPLLYDALSSLEAQPFRGPAMRAMTVAKHILTRGVTISPTFRIRNVIRDQLSAIATNPVSMNFLSNAVKGFRYSSHNNPEWGSMLAGGALFRQGIAMEGDRGAYVKKLVARGIDPNTVLDTPSKVKAAFGKVWDWYEETGERSESITRATVYKQAYDKAIAEGMEPDRAHFEAAYAARDVLDFGLRGSWPAIRMLTQVVPFMNARLQGIYKLGRGAKDDPRRFALAVGGIMLSTIALTLAYRGDDDWEKRDEWDRDNFWWFKVGDTAFRIPKPFEIGAFGTIVDRALEASLNGLEPVDRERFLSRLGPIIGGQLAMNPIPQAVFPAIELWANKSLFFGRSIESQRDENLSPSQRVGPYTSATAQALTHVARIPGVGQLSPEQIDFLVNAYLGWAGTHAVALADLAVRPAMGLPERASRRVDQYFVVGDFARELPANQSRFMEQFYTHLKEVQQAMGDVRQAQATGQFEKAAELTKENQPKIAIHALYGRTQRELSKLNQQVRFVENSRMEPDVKRARLDQLAQTKIRLAEQAETARAGLEARR